MKLHCSYDTRIVILVGACHTPNPRLKPQTLNLRFAKTQEIFAYVFCIYADFKTLNLS